MQLDPVPICWHESRCTVPIAEIGSSSTCWRNIMKTILVTDCDNVCHQLKFVKLNYGFVILQWTIQCKWITLHQWSTCTCELPLSIYLSYWHYTRDGRHYIREQHFEIPKYRKYRHFTSNIGKSYTNIGNIVNIGGLGCMQL